jgi:two-component system chemotaxis response regulator CheY
MARLILVVDDSTAIRSLVCDTLVNAGFDVVEAEDGEDALQRAQRAHFDLVLSDQNMPRLDGLGMVRALRRLDQYRKVPILMLTTESSNEMTEQGRLAGATGWIVKPFDPHRLLHVVQRVLG